MSHWPASPPQAQWLLQEACIRVESNCIVVAKGLHDSFKGAAFKRLGAASLLQ